MIIQNIVIQAETNSTSKVACKIEANSVMFELLSSRLYQDKPLAVVRELSTNALDAQIENGNSDIPFVVHLPTKLEPFFSIRDFGTGMSEETVMELYSTMGSSSKRESNLLNGALGVGSKSPFAYTQGGAFTLASFIGGEKHIYSVYSDGGVPSIALLGKFVTDEPNGVEISVPVQMEDISTFTSKASFIYSWFKVKPITNARLEYINLENPVFQGTNWKIFPNGLSSKVLMANVAYPIDSRNYSGLSLLGTNGLVIEANTGDIQMAGSREGLSYTKETLDKLREYENIINKELKATVNEMLEKSTNYLEVAEAMSALPREVLNGLSTVEFPKFLSLNWNEVKISSGDYLNFREPKYYGTKFNKASCLSGKKLKNANLIYEDTVASGSLVLAYYRTQGKDVIGLQRKPDMGAYQKTEIEEEAKELFSKIGLPFVKSSELAVTLGLITPRVKGQKRSSPSVKMQGSFNSIVYNPQALMQYPDTYTKNIDKAINPIYVPMIGVSEADKNWGGVVNGNSSTSVLGKIYNTLVYLKYKKEVTFIAVTKKDKGYAKGLEHYADFFKREFQNYVIRDTTTRGKLILDGLSISFGSWSDIGGLPNDFYKLVKYFESINKYSYNSSDATRTRSFFGSMGLNITKIEEDVPAEISSLVEKYLPILKTLSYNPRGKEAVFQFVRLVNIIDEHSKIKQNKRS